MADSFVQVAPDSTGKLIDNESVPSLVSGAPGVVQQQRVKVVGVVATQDDDKQYDDDGIPYVNPNVPGADIATGDKQSQILGAIQGLGINTPVTVGNFPASQNVAVGNFPATQNVSVGNFPAVQAVSGSLSITPLATPTIVQDDDKQYDDEDQRHTLFISFGHERLLPAKARDS